MRRRPRRRKREASVTDVLVYLSVCLLGLGILTPAPATAADDPSNADSDSEQSTAEDASESTTDPDADSDEPTVEDEESLFDVSDDGEPDDESEGEERQERKRRDDVPLRKMDREQAEQAGFDFGGNEESATRTTGALLAATGGLVAHGLGHWYVEDPRTAFTLAALEGSSLALIGSGLAVWLTNGESAAGSAYGKAAFHMGAGLFGISYLIDVMGALQGARLRLPENTGRSTGLSVHAGYRYRNASGHPLRHFFVGRVDYDLGPVFGSARTEQEFQLDLSEYSGEIGVRLIRGKRDMTFGYVNVIGDALSYRGEGRFDRTRGEIRIGMSLDFGLVAPHLEQLAIGAEVGGGLAWRGLPGAGDETLEWAAPSPYLPAEVYTDLNLTERFNARLSYEQRSGDHLQATRPLAGVGELRFRYDSSDLFDLELAGRVGGGYTIHAGLGLKVWE